MDQCSTEELNKPRGKTSSHGTKKKHPTEEGKGKLWKESVWTSQTSSLCPPHGRRARRSKVGAPEFRMC